MDKFFKLTENGTTAKREVMAGVITFMTMAYIMFVNPSILSSTGMDAGAVFVATILAAVIATLIMGLAANVPYALAPGMGMNAFFAYTICLGMKIPWQQALGIVFICGIINIIITVTQIRKMIILAIPLTLQYAISGGIGLFIAYIGLMNGGLLSFLPNSEPGPSGAFSVVVPSLANFADKTALLTVIGLVITVVLMLKKLKSAILIGILATTLIGIPLGVTTVADLSTVSFIPPSISPTLFKLDIIGLFSDPDQLFMIITLIIAFSLADTFDTIGTFLGTGQKTGIFNLDELSANKGGGFKTKFDKALFADATATSIGALLGTSNTTTYVESASGIEAGGKTGLTSTVVALLFLLSLFLSPIAGMVPASATSSALIVVGILMMEPLMKVKWSEFEEAAPAFLTAVIMPFAYNIATGISAGFLFYVITKIAEGKAKDVHPILYIIVLLFLAKYLVDALQVI